MNREITTHIVHEEDRQPAVIAKGNVGVGGAEQAYTIEYDLEYHKHTVRLNFISLAHGGVTNEALLAIVVDRLEGFQAGDFACEENTFALRKVKDALNALQARTRDRIARNVEGRAKV